MKRIGTTRMFSGKEMEKKFYRKLNEKKILKSCFHNFLTILFLKNKSKAIKEESSIFFLEFLLCSAISGATRA